MKPRIEKKLSKRIAQILPKTYCDAWFCQETNELCVGGGVDYWGEGQDTYTVFEDFSHVKDYRWFGMFGWHPEGHRMEGFPLLDKKRSTGKRVIEIAKLIAANDEKSFKAPVLIGRCAT